MDFTTFVEVLGQYYRLDLQQQQFLHKHLQRQRLAAHLPLFEIGEVPRRLYFLYGGVVRSHYYDKDTGEEITAWFSQEQRLIGNIQHFMLQRPLEETITAALPLSLYYLEGEDVYQVLKQASNLSALYYRFMRDYLRLITNRSYCRDPMPTDERIRRFEEVFPGLIRRLNQRHVASYLGLKRETLNRHL